MNKNVTIKIKSFEITGVDIDAYMKEYDIESEQEAIKDIQQTAIDVVNETLITIGVKER